ncbi:MAG: molybdenum cofactor biosynthesis protein MoaE [Acidobacteria bacterium]|nr:molybdenum cofactor biosynthesis protein MoaE [Acidobacteriota bacterium]
MQVHVLFFGQLREIVGRAEDRIEMEDGARVENVFSLYGARFPKLANFRPSLVASVNQEFADWKAVIRSGDEIAFLPPVSGGQASGLSAAVEEDIFEIVRSPIRTAELTASCKAPQDGAVVTFDGIVRDNSGGRQTLYLEYEAYEPMALAKMKEIGREIREKFPVHRIAMVHRLGRLEISETSVFIAVSSPHRRAAFDACRYAIDTLKKTVPIWKKEFFADGAVWAEGEIPPVKPASSKSESNT